jgi:hypothetical protein
MDDCCDRLGQNDADRWGCLAMLKTVVAFYRREVRGEGIHDELPKGMIADLTAMWFVGSIVAIPLLVIWF